MESSTKLARLAFCTPKMSPESAHSLGVQKKVEGQVRGFQKLGFHVEHFGSAPYPYGTRSGQRQNILRELSKAGAYNRKCTRENLAELHQYQPDALYIRYNFSDSHFIYFLKNLRKSIGRQVPVFLEIATYPYDRELRSAGRPGLFFLYLVDWFYRRSLHNYIDLVITYGNYQRIFGIPTIKISNGVDCETISPAASRSTNVNKKEFHFIGVSNLVYWTGYERMIMGLADYLKDCAQPKVFFHVVGEGLYLEPLKELAAQKGVGEYVVFHGAHSGDALDRLFQGKHLAVGNLGVHRKGMVTNPDLKNREYCARGIPFVTSTSDPGFPVDFPYVLGATPDEAAIKIRDLVDQVENLRINHPESAKEMREFAEKHFEWSITLKPVADRIKSAVWKKR